MHMLFLHRGHLLSSPCIGNSILMSGACEAKYDFYSARFSSIEKMKSSGKGLR
jgi:hypothetical protein